MRRQIERLVMQSPVSKRSREWHERVGVITLNEVAGSMFFAVHEVQNNHPEPWDHFSIRTADVAAVLDVRSVVEVIGLVHSHPTNDPADKWPSERDYNALPQGLFGMIVAPKFHTVCFYDRNDTTHDPRVIVRRSTR